MTQNIKWNQGKGWGLLTREDYLQYMSEYGSTNILVGKVKNLTQQIFPEPVENTNSMQYKKMLKNINNYVVFIYVETSNKQRLKYFKTEQAALTWTKKYINKHSNIYGK
jgi:hypothetical protein